MTDAFTNSKRHIAALDGVRFLAALLVFVAHFFHANFPAETGNFLLEFMRDLAPVGMSLFFVLSGYVIHYNYREMCGRKDYWRFAIARFSRLYPLYILVIIASLTWNLQTRGIAWPGADNLWVLPFYLLGIQSWFYKVDGVALIPALGDWVAMTWSISTEIFFYLVYAIASPLLTLAAESVGPKAKRRALKLRHVCLATAIAYILVFLFLGSSDGSAKWLYYNAPYLRVGEFLMGCLVVGRAGKWMPPLAILLFTHAVLSALDLSYVFAPVFYAPIFAYLVSLSLVNPLWLLSWKPVARLGKASYSVYLLHAPFISFPVRFLGPLSAALSPLLTAAVSLICYKLYERPMQKALRRSLEMALTN